jgi:hypothetical protein
MQRKGGGSKKFLNLYSSDFYNHKYQKEDPENAISNNLETQHFFGLLDANHGSA